MYHENMYDLCKKHIHRYVLIQTTDNQTIDGIIENVDENYVYLAIPTGEASEPVRDSEERIFGGGIGGYGYPGYGFPGYGYPGAYGGYPYYYRPRRRFSRLVLPLAFVTGLSLLPYF